MTQITMRIINPTDQQQIAQSIESASRELISELPSPCERSRAIISGVAINTPTLVRRRKRLTSDVRGRSKDAPALWGWPRRGSMRRSMGRAEVRARMRRWMWGCESG
jgi:DNA helicase HerA-like ATPase